MHNFYLGNTGKAVAQLLLTLVGWILLGLGPIAAAIWGFVKASSFCAASPAHRGIKTPTATNYQTETNLGPRSLGP